MRRPPRIAVLIAALAGVAIWVALDFRNQPAATKPAASTTAAAPAGPAARAAPETPPEIPARDALGKIGSDPFSARSWTPPPKPVAASAPPPPVAPPLPFRFAGQLHRDSGLEVFLARGDQIFSARDGDTLDGQYKVEAVGATEVSFVHLPSGTRQTLQFIALREEGSTALVQPARPAKPIASAAATSPTQPAAAKQAPTASPALSEGASLDKTGPAQLRWDGPASARAGASFKVSLRVTSSEQIRAAPMQVRFDPAVLESVSVQPGGYFGAAKSAFGYRVNTDGSIFVGASNQTPAPASDAEILVLTFKTIRPAAAAEISIASLNLQGAAGRAINYSSPSPFKTTITP